MGMVSVHAVHCGHCGAAIVPAAARNETPSNLVCPSCKGAKLTSTQLGDVKVDQCAHCGGVWLRQDLFDQVSAGKEARGRALGVLPTAMGPKAFADIEVRYRPCPVCLRMMNRYNYARISGVIIDGCKNDGLWFDKDELRKVLEFIQAGGLEKSHEREAARLEQEQRTKAQMARLDLGMHPSSYGEFSTRNGHKSGDGFLSNLVDGLMEHFSV
jgi:Zn-finger nucleic acid-binding protein